MPRVIAICGLKRSGKDVLANYISKTYGYSHCKIAHPLKKLISDTFDISEDVLETSKKDEVHQDLNIKPRQLMDFIGTHVFQHEIQKLLPHIGRSFWINKIVRDIKPDDYVVISDLRFVHEWETLKSFDTLTIKIVRPFTSSDGLESEKEIDHIKEDILLVNDGTIEDMCRKVSKHIVL